MGAIDRVREWIASDPALSSLLAEVERRVGTDGDADPGHDVGHLLRVARWTVRIAGPSVDRRAALAAALLHDVVNPPKDSPARADAGDDSARVAAELLPALGFEPGAVAEIAEAIEDHGYSRGTIPRSDLGRALQDADRLDALGAIGIFRALACGVRMNAALFDPEDPWADKRPLDDKRFTLDHFFTKLFALPETLHTETGRREALARVEFMRSFVARLGQEISGEDPRG